MKSRVFALPVIGYVLRLFWLSIRLPRLVDAFDRLEQSTAQRLNDSEDRLTQTSATIEKKIDEAQDIAVNLEDQIDDVKHRLAEAEKARHASVVAAAPANSNNATSDLLADDHDLDSFYVEFENKFRGTETEIKNRLKVYVSYFHNTGLNFKKYPVLDIGCGRGELLSLLMDNDIRAIGLDLNESMVDRCKELGYEAVQAEALSYLSQQPSNSLGAITGFHIVEHIPFGFLLRLFEECHRVLAPGGIIIFETPNPENLHVGSYSFYYDPSHLHPLVPDVLEFAIKNRGFNKTEILRLHPKGDGKENEGRNDQYVSQVLDRFYGPQDYSVIGYKLASKATKK